MAGGEAAGMMSGLFFVSKGELLKWLNDFFKLNCSKVEEAATGAIHCQILDSIFPGKVPLQKVNFNAKYDYEYVANFKILQDVFSKEGLKKQMDVAKLVQGKFQDNLEFLQWMKHLWDTRYTGEEYDALARREEAMRVYSTEHKFSGKSSVKTTQAPPSHAVARPSKPAVISKQPPKQPLSAPKQPVASKPVARPPAATTTKPAAKVTAQHTSSDAPSNSEEVAELNSTISKLKVTIEGLEKERNFYFGKLREIEILCQADDSKDQETKQKVLEILYATDGAEDFEAPQAEAVENAEEAIATEAVESSENVEDYQQNENDGVIDDENPNF